MNKKNHVVAGIVAGVAFYLLGRDLFASSVMVIMGSIFPDFDLIGNDHRNWIWHSVLIPMIITIYAAVINPSVRLGDAAALLFAVGIHLLLDIKPGAVGKAGTYNIVKFNKRWSFRKTDAYLAINAICGIGIALLIVYLTRWY